MKLGNIEFGTTPRICAVLTGPVDVKAIKKTAKDGADLIEIRVDGFKDRNPVKLKTLLQKISQTVEMPLLLTIRSEREGGASRISDIERLMLFKELTPHVAAIDIELGSKTILKDVLAVAKSNKKRSIVSYHNFKNTPVRSRLDKVLKDSSDAGGDIVKIATAVKIQNDIKRLAGLLVENKNLITIGMGEKGRASRILFPVLGSLITYASVAGKTAPGQMSLVETKKAFTALGY